MKLSEFLERQRAERQAKKLQMHHLKEPDDDFIKKRKTMDFSVKEGSMHAVMEGITDQFTTPFALALGGSAQFIAFLASVPQLAGAFLQLFSEQLTRIWNNRVRLITIITFIQTFMLLAYILLPYQMHKLGLLLIFVTAFTVFGMLQSPIWNSIMGDVVPANERGRYFGKRTSIITFILFSTTFLAGLLLNYFKGQNKVLLGFSIIFFTAFAAKFLSAFYKARMHDPPHKIPESHTKDFLEFIRNLTKTNYGRFVFYMLFLKFAVAFSAPFFAVFELRDLGFSYIQFTILTVSSTLASFISFRLWGKFIDNYGSKNALVITGLTVPLFPLMWVFYPHFPALLFTEIIAGVVWAGFNLASSNFLFDATTSKNRTKSVAYINFFIGIGLFVGALIGGYIAKNLPIIPVISSISNLPVLFLASSVLRLAAALVFLRYLRESRLIEIDFQPAFWNISLGKNLMIMPSGSSVLEIRGSKPIISIPPEHHAKVHPKHFDHLHYEPSRQDEAFVERLLEKTGTAKKPEVPQHEQREYLLSTPKDETPAVDKLLGDIKKGKFEKEFAKAKTKIKKK